MRGAFLIFLLVFSSSMSFGQDEDAWRDSLKIARKAYENKNYAEALKYYESTQKIAPDDIDLSDEMAQSAYKARDFERAEKIYQQGSSTKMSKRDRADAMHNMGNAQMRQENYEGAIESYKEALRNNPNDEETRYNLSKAIRKVKEQRTPPPKKQQQNQNDPQDEDPNSGNSGQQGNQGDQQNGEGDKSQNQGNQGSEGQNSKSKPGQGGGGSDDSSSKGKLSNQMVERTLDKIAKKEAETKRNMMGAGSSGRGARSGKDW